MWKVFLCMCGIAAVVIVNGQFDLVSQKCLDCLCEASSGCALSTQCHNEAENYFCGPYLITYSYWSEGGSPGKDPNNPQDFEVCLKDRTCAEKAVVGYMKKWGKDCDNDGNITCYDFARIHKAGPIGCNTTSVLNTPYWAIFNRCFS
ncbi:lysozyme-like [Limulus polyphemus]|uniref:lysozyme n=1 Tax=Limulus polyphemus TaxID=6850 RepID=A0ABM1RYB4_LIMPO|nr:lysozyme-like [Limulus polyphemus]